MILNLKLVDTDTGEIISNICKDYACNFSTKNDAGFRFLMEWCMCAVRGVRMTEHKHIELRIHFSEKIPLPQLPFGMTIDDSRKLAAQYVR